MDWIKDDCSPVGYYGGPSLRTLKAKSPNTNGHLCFKDDRDVSMNYKDDGRGRDNFPAKYSGKCVKGSKVTLPRPHLSMNQVRKLKRYGKVPEPLKIYTNKQGILPEPILRQYF